MSWNVLALESSKHNLVFNTQSERWVLFGGGFVVILIDISGNYAKQTRK